MSAKPIPDGYPAITPYLIIDGAAAAIEFYQKVFGATERMRMGAPEGRVGHAELLIGGSLIMLADEFPEMGARGPKSVGGSPVSLHLYVEDVEAHCTQARNTGAKIVTEPKTTDYGEDWWTDRGYEAEDLEGHHWWFYQRLRDAKK